MLAVVLACRVRQQVTHWTQASPDKHDHTVLIDLEEIISDIDGTVLQKHDGKLSEVGSGTEAFVFKVVSQNSHHQAGRATANALAESYSSSRS